MTADRRIDSIVEQLRGARLTSEQHGRLTRAIDAVHVLRDGEAADRLDLTPHEQTGTGIVEPDLEPGAIVATCAVCPAELASEVLVELRHEADGAHTIAVPA